MALAMSGDEFKLNFVDALKDKDCVQALADIIKKSNESLLDEIKSLKSSVTYLKDQIEVKDSIILSLRQDNANFVERLDDMEQYSRRASMRIYGLDENSPKSTDEQVLDLVNSHLKLEPPLEEAEIEVSHRVGKSDDLQSKPRATLVKFVSRRSKARVMGVRTLLKDLPPQRVNAESAAEDGPPRLPHKIFFSDDLTNRRANLAWQARQSKKEKLIEDTWVWDCKVLIKDIHGRIRAINNKAELRKFENRVVST